MAEGARKDPKAMVVSSAPDVCKTPSGPAMVPVPYPIVGMCSALSGDAQSVLMTGMTTFTKATKVTTVVGDEPGVGGGVKSSVNKNTCEPIMASTTVEVEGQGLVRHDDQFQMNNGNTVGKMVYPLDMGGGGGGDGEKGERPSITDDGKIKGDTNKPALPETPAEKAVVEAASAAAENAPQAPIEGFAEGAAAAPPSWMGAWGEAIHSALDVAGMVPFVGEVADGANALLYVSEGDLVNAGISAAALVPVGGQAATGGRLAYKGGKEVLEHAAKEEAQHVVKEGVQEAEQRVAQEAEQRAAQQADSPAASAGGDGGGKKSGGGDDKPPDKPSEPKKDAEEPKKPDKPEEKGEESSSGSGGGNVTSMGESSGAASKKAQQVKKNKKDGLAREKQTEKELKEQNPDASVQSEQYLRDKDGKIAKDPLSGEGRRIDHVVIKDGKVVDMVETTSMTADKTTQIAKQARIESSGGSFIRDRTTGKLVDASGVPTREIRRP